MSLGNEQNARNSVQIAIDKQLSKKPTIIIKETSSRQYKFYYCSRCEINLESKEKYCSNCGQKLDWSDLSERD